MPRKAMKFEVCTGKSLRRSDHRYSQRNSRQACLIQHHRHSQSENFESLSNDPRLADFNDLQDDVVYSLNKKGRWCLPELIKNQIQLMRYAQDEPIRLSLLEKHKLKRQANCISYQTSAADVSQIKPKKTYFNESNIHSKQRRTRKSRRNRRSVEEETSDEDTNLPEVHFDIFHPSPMTHSVNHIRKLRSTKETVLFLADKGNKKRGSKQRSHLTTTEYFHTHVFDDTETDVYGDSSDVNDEAADCCPDMTAYVFGEILEQALTQDSVRKAEKERGVHLGLVENTVNTDIRNTECKTGLIAGKFGKGTAIYIDEPLPQVEVANNNKQEKTRSESSTRLVFGPQRGRRGRKRKAVRKVHGLQQSVYEMTTARILIPSHELTSSHLERLFGGKYFEARCEPRTFGVNISKEVGEICTKKFIDFRRQEIWSWLIFVLERQEQDGLDVCRVLLNFEAGARLHDPELKTLTEMDVYSIDEVLRRSMLFVECYTDEEFSRVPIKVCARVINPMLTFDTLRSLRGWEYDAYHVTQTHRRGWHTLAQNFTENTEPEEQLLSERQNLDMCPICCDSITDTLTVTSIKPCGHTFCNQCWTSHILSQINQACLQLTCPDFGCTSNIDHITALNLIRATKYKSFLQRCHDYDIRRDRNTIKWCPNSKCGRIVIVRDSGAEDRGMCITCECGYPFCFQCLSEPHWPATCQQAKEYSEKRTKLGDHRKEDKGQLPVVVLQVKYCPKCKEAINKNGGCPSMVCFCGYRFCWTCLGRRSMGNHEDCQTRMNNDHHRIQRKYFRKEAEKVEGYRSPLYQLSLQHRKCRSAENLKQMSKQAFELKTAIRVWVLKHSSPVEESLFPSSQAPSDREDAATHTDSLVSSVLRLIPELDVIIEHLAVMYDVDTKRSHPAMITSLFTRLQFIANRLKQILHDGSKQEKRDVVQRLQHLKDNARECISALYTAVSHLHKQPTTLSSK